MWLTAAEAVTPPSDFSAVAVWTFLGVVVTTLGLLAQQLLRGRNERTGTTASPPPASDAETLIKLAKDAGALGEGYKILTQRAEDSDDRDQIQDVRHEACERRAEDLGRRIYRLESFLRLHHSDWTDS